jgi:hypothetical protein
MNNSPDSAGSNYSSDSSIMDYSGGIAAHDPYGAQNFDDARNLLKRVGDKMPHYAVLAGVGAISLVSLAITSGVLSAVNEEKSTISSTQTQQRVHNGYGAVVAVNTVAVAGVLACVGLKFYASR